MKLRCLLCLLLLPFSVSCRQFASALGGCTVSDIRTVLEAEWERVELSSLGAGWWDSGLIRDPAYFMNIDLRYERYDVLYAQGDRRVALHQEKRHVRLMWLRGEVRIDHIDVHPWEFTDARELLGMNWGDSHDGAFAGVYYRGDLEAFLKPLPPVAVDAYVGVWAPVQSDVVLRIDSDPGDSRVFLHVDCFKGRLDRELKVTKFGAMGERQVWWFPDPMNGRSVSSMDAQLRLYPFIGRAGEPLLKLELYNMVEGQWQLARATSCVRRLADSDEGKVLPPSGFQLEGGGSRKVSK